MGGKPYTRFPAKAKAYTSNVSEGTWGTAQRSAGIKTRFSTAASDVWVHWHLDSQVKGDWLWPATGHAGIDIYIDDDESALDPQQRWCDYLLQQASLVVVAPVCLSRFGLTCSIYSVAHGT